AEVQVSQDGTGEVELSAGPVPRSGPQVRVEHALRGGPDGTVGTGGRLAQVRGQDVDHRRHVPALLVGECLQRVKRTDALVRSGIAQPVQAAGVTLSEPALVTGPRPRMRPHACSSWSTPTGNASTSFAG